jgi:hypothetical protein
MSDDHPEIHLGKSSTFTVCDTLIDSLPNADIILNPSEDRIETSPIIKDHDGYYKCEECFDVENEIVDICKFELPYKVTICEFEN